MTSAGQSDGRRWCASFRDLDGRWHGISGFPPGESGRKKPHQRCWFCYHELRWWWNMVFVRCFIYVFTEGHMFGTFWLDTCLLSAKLQQPRSTWQNEESTKRQDWKIQLRWTIFLNTRHKAMQYHMFSLDWTHLCGWNPLWLTSQDGYGRLPDLNLPEKLFWEQPEPRSLGGLRVL